MISLLFLIENIWKNYDFHVYRKASITDFLQLRVLQCQISNSVNIKTLIFVISLTFDVLLKKYLLKWKIYFSLLFILNLWLLKLYLWLGSLKVVSATFLLVCFVCLKEHLRNKEKWFLFHFESSFRSWDNQILTF